MASEPDTTAVRDSHRFDQDALERYLRRHLPGFPRQPSDDALAVRQYSSGQSNPTFYLKKGSRTYVLRKKPHGPLLPRAHKIDREFRVQKTLFAAGFPVPEPLLYCDDSSVIGTEFYVMQHVQGRIFRNMALPEVSPAERSALYVALIETLARLHSFDVKSTGLQDYGRGPGYCKRQVSAWKRQYEAAADTDIPAMNDLAEWLTNNIPPDDYEEKLVHGDFRIDNVIFHPKEARVIAVLDWELSTIGHPLADFAYLLTFYLWPRTLKHMQTQRFQSLAGVAGKSSGLIRLAQKLEKDEAHPYWAFVCPWLSLGSHIIIPCNIKNMSLSFPGIPSFEELTMVYSRCRGTSIDLSNLIFFLSLSYFKFASISQGVYARYRLGNSSAENSSEYGKLVKPLAETGLQVAKQTQFTTDVQPCNEGELFRQSQEGREVLQKVKEFMGKYVFPAEKEMVEYYARTKHSADVWKKPAVIERLKKQAKAEGLWNLFLPAVSGLGQVDYALIAEEMGKSYLGPEVFNCQAPDTGNMEVLHLYGTEEQKKQWLEPLLEGTINSCFCMTEPDVASSDATNIQCSLQRHGDSYIVNGKKWWSSGAGNPNCKFAIVMVKDKNSSASRYKQHSMIIVPMETPGVKIVRPLSVFGYLDYFHGGHFEVHFNNVRVPVSNLILGEGRGFEIAQGRLGPGRIHHCMRSIGAAETALRILCERAAQRTTFGKKLYRHEVVAHWIAECRIAIEQARLLTLKAASKIDALGNKEARKEVAMIKVLAPRAVLKVIDCAIQVCGAAGFSDDFPLAQMYAHVRTLRVADGPDEVHLSTIAKLELLNQAKRLNSHL